MMPRRLLTVELRITANTSNTGVRLCQNSSGLYSALPGRIIRWKSLEGRSSIIPGLVRLSRGGSETCLVDLAGTHCDAGQNV